MRRTAAEDATRQEQGMSKAAKIWIGIGTVLIVAAAALTLYNIWDAARAGGKAVRGGILARMRRDKRLTGFHGLLSSKWASIGR